MPVDIKREIDEVKEDGEISPDEVGKVMKIFDMAVERIEKLHEDAARARDEFEKKRDAQIVQMAVVVSASVAISMLGLLAGLGYQIGQIGTIMLMLCGSLVASIGMAFVKRHIPALVEPIKKVVAAVGPVIPKPITDTLDEAIKDEQP